MIFTPREHQELMREHMLRYPRCAVWADMGLGKTSAALSVIQALDLVEPGPTLVLAPKRVALNVWSGEVEKFDTFKDIHVIPILGSAKARRAILDGKRADIYTINYENLPWLIEECTARKKWPFTKVIADESTRLKSFRLRGGGKRAKAVAKAAHTQVKHWVNLTGTPSPNGLLDQWGQMWFIDQGKRLGRTFTAFKNRWFDVNLYSRTTTPKPGALKGITDALGDICLAIRAEDWFPVDKPIFTNLYVDLPSKAFTAYKQMEKLMYAQLEEGGIVEAYSAAAKTMKCLQIANGAVYTDGTTKTWTEVHDVKLQALESIISEANGAPLLVAYQFKSDLARILKAFPKARHLDQKPATLRAWNRGEIPILVAHPASAGHGINMQDGGHRLVFFGHWWALEEYLQIIERIGPVRQKQSGYDRPVFVYNIVARNTIDELVLERRESKCELQQLLMKAKAKRRT